VTLGHYIQTPTGYACLRCPYRGKSFLGIQSHIRKHKNEDERAREQEKKMEGQQKLEASE